MRRLFFLLICLLFSLFTKAQSDTLKYYLDPARRFLATSDGAAFIRLVIKEKPKDKKFVVQEYYLNTGALKSVGQSRYQDGDDNIGAYMEYSVLGKRARYREYDMNGIIKSEITYYPNGQIMKVLKRENRQLRLIMEEWRDSTGKATVENGNGIMVAKEGDHEDAGPVVDGWKSGDWVHKIKGNVVAQMTYEKGKLVSGLGRDSLGSWHPFTDITHEYATYKDGPIQLYNKVKGNIKISKQMRKELLGRELQVDFWVDQTGKIEGFKLIKRIGYGLDEQVIEQLTKTDGEWVCAKYYGVPVKTKTSFWFRIADGA